LQLAEGASPDSLVGLSNAIHAHPDEVDAAAEPIGEGFVNVVAVRSERHRELCLSRRVLAQVQEAGVERWFASTKAYSESAVRVKLGEPARDDVVAKLVAGLGGVAMRARQVAPVCESN
jgi:hypothetical protein